MIEVIKGKPLELQNRTVPGEWIDYNGHMNVAYYLLAADRAYDAFLAFLGIDSATVARGGTSTFALENHIVYLREMLEGDPFHITLQLLDWDHKRIHYLLNLHQTRARYLAAAVEGLSIFMDMTARRTTTMPREIAEKVEKVWQAHRDLPWPDGAGRKIGIRR